MRDSYIKFTKNIFQSLQYAFMEPIDFLLLIVPLTVLLFVLVLTVLYYARKGERVGKELRNLRGGLLSETEVIQALGERGKKEKDIVKELERLDVLLHDKSIDQSAYNRLRKILVRALMIEAGYDHVASDIDGKMYFGKHEA